MDPTTVIEQLGQHIAPAIPVILWAAAVYLAGNDLLDFALDVKAARAQRKAGLIAAIRLVGFAGLVGSVKADFWNSRVAVVAGGAVATALATGADPVQALQTALVAAAVANVGSLESSTLTKIKQLFAAVSAPTPPPSPPVSAKTIAAAAATRGSVVTQAPGQANAGVDPAVTELLSDGVTNAGSPSS
jgi:hypothetical protein